eukprot:TRINITY_DN16146_c1_g1_i1.p1 TRINITY_DN16146_c1_g1~~TRINITY_DN16146_c1_g1_i1.p1  ORF type:complete len:568 (+),score=134.18 TRINITY_DN16146_c1_g1_i1:132-1835(+)
MTAAQEVELAVPEGCGPGQVLQVTLEGGHEVRVTVPAGVAAGQTFVARIEVPKPKAALPVASPINQAPQGGKGKGGGKKGGPPVNTAGLGEWVCPQCNWKNRERNTCCGGEKGDLGCKAVRPGLENTTAGNVARKAQQQLAKMKARKSDLLCCMWAQGKCGYGLTCKNQHEDDGQRLCTFGTECTFPPHRQRLRELGLAPAKGGGKGRNSDLPALLPSLPELGAAGGGGAAAGAAPAAAGEQKMQITIPAGVNVGDTMEVTFPDGQSALVQVPPGMSPGMDMVLTYSPRDGAVSSGKADSGGKGGKPGQNEGDWACTCGFKNRARNTICGGKGGKMGCQTPREQGDVMYAAGAAQQYMYPGAMRPQPLLLAGPGVSAGTPDWVCPLCGNPNHASAQICMACGGAGIDPYAAAAAWGGGAAWGAGAADMAWGGGKGLRGAAVHRPDGGKGGKGGKSSGPKWRCPCGFNNRASNKVCGGSGTLGCKAPRPDGGGGGGGDEGFEMPLEGELLPDSDGHNSPDPAAEAQLAQLEQLQAQGVQGLEEAIANARRRAAGGGAPAAKRARLDQI